MTNIPDLAAGDLIPFSWLNAVKRMAQRARTTIAPGSGLTCRQTDDGTVIGLEPFVALYHAEVTEVVSLANGRRLGRGKAKLFDEMYNAAGEGDLADIPGDVPDSIDVYFGAPSGGKTSPIAPGERVILGRTVSGRYSVISGYC